MQFFEIAWQRAIGASPSDTPVAIRAAPLPSVSQASQRFAFLFTKVRLPLDRFPNPSEIKDSSKSWP
jgi:hypothetical protein